MSTVLVTGGVGYIGSHTVLALLREGHSVIIVDDLRNSKMEVVRRIGELSGRDFSFHQTDVCNGDAMHRIFENFRIDAVIHFAGLKAVAESVAVPLAYYRNNLDSTLTLLELMTEFGVTKIVFSSSATVYDPTSPLPLSEQSALRASNPYGWSKLMNEEILRSYAAAEPEAAIVLLRYFNPIGADKSGRIGEDPKGIPNNLMPYITQVAVGKRESLQIFGADYPTRDGTGVRDYLHVLDLAAGHLLALDYLSEIKGVQAFNLGTGTGYSVLEVIRAFEEVSGRTIKYEIAERRSGDLAEVYSDPSLAASVLGWRAERDLKEMCLDSWRWQEQNPNGYEEEYSTDI